MIMNTTNGTKAVTRASLARKILIGCFLNAASVVDELLHAEGGIIIICAGWKSRFSLEDMLCAGLIIDRLSNGELRDDASDGAKLAQVLYQKDSNDVEAAVSQSNHAIRLTDIAHPNDISYCSQLDQITIVPYMKDGIIVP
jgi:2-phosphosulfolactate phosphatase